MVTVEGAEYEEFGFDADVTLRDGMTPEDAVPDLLKLLAASCARRSSPRWVLREIAYMHGPEFGAAVDALIDSYRPDPIPAAMLVGDVFRVETDAS